VQACESGHDAKLVALTRWVRAIHEADQSKKVIVFNEYADTVNANVAHLALTGYARTTVTRTGEITSRADRVSFRPELTHDPSGAARSDRPVQNYTLISTGLLMQAPLIVGHSATSDARDGNPFW
jgi:hypothetical protein